MTVNRISRYALRRRPGFVPERTTWLNEHDMRGFATARLAIMRCPRPVDEGPVAVRVSFAGQEQDRARYYACEDDAWQGQYVLRCFGFSFCRVLYAAGYVND